MKMHDSSITILTDRQDVLFEIISVIKIIAICMMIIHHFLGFPAWLTESNQLVEIPFLSTLRLLVGKQCKFCIALYAFVTGYSIYTGKEKYKKARYTFCKILQLLIVHWLCYFLMLILGFFLKEPMPNLGQVLLTAFGLGVEINVSYLNNPFSWYVFFYIIVVIIMPFFADLLDKTHIRRGILAFCVLCALLYVIKHFGGEQVFRPTTYIRYLVVAMAGAICAKIKLFKRFENDCFYHKISFFKGAFLLLFFTGVILLVRSLSPVFIDWMLAPLYIIAIENVIVRTKISDLQLYKNRIRFLAKYSTAMWFLQAVFFTPNRSIQGVAFWSNIGCIVFVWSYIILLGASIVCVRICEFISKKLNI